MTWIAAAVVGGSLISGMASKSAADTQANAANNATQAQWQMFNTVNNQQAPWRNAGQSALKPLSAGVQPGGQFNTPFTAADLNSNLAPNYQFQLQQGLGQAANAQNASGGLIGGNALQGLNTFAQNYAGNAYQQAFNNYNSQQTNIYNRLSNLAGLGQTANQTVAQAGTQLAGNIGNYGTQAAAAQAAGTVGVANAVNSGVGNLMGWNYLNNSGGGGGAAQVPSSALSPVVPDQLDTSLQTAAVG